MRLHGQSPARRVGFTLIELLVVMSIVVVLIGVGIGATMKFRDMSTDRAADDQLKQLQPALRLQYDTVVRDCNKSGAVPPEVLAYAGNDMDRARAIHTAATLRVSFPETVAEASSPATDLQGRPCAFMVGSQPYYSKAAFKQFTGVTFVSPDEESAALLYVVLMEQAVGLGNSEVKASESMVTASSGKTFNVFRDPYGTPVRYYRWARSPELNAAPYAPTAAASRDPFDPKNKVAGNTAYTTPLNAAPLNLGFTGENRVPSVVSFGKDKKNDNFAPGGDDRVGYRLDRQGAQGK